MHQLTRETFGPLFEIKSQVDKKHQMFKDDYVTNMFKMYWSDEAAQKQPCNNGQQPSLIPTKQRTTTKYYSH